MSLVVVYIQLLYVYRLWTYAESFVKIDNNFYPNEGAMKFLLIPQWEVCQEEGIKKGGNWRTLRAPNERHG